jgi:hypothetical protein
MDPVERKTPEALVGLGSGVTTGVAVGVGMGDGVELAEGAETGVG